MAYSKGAFAESLGISRGELENRAKSAGFGTTEDYYNSGQWKGGGTSSMGDPYADAEKKYNAFWNEYGTAVANQPSISDIYTRRAGELGYQPALNLATGLTQTALGTQGRLSNLPSQIQAETRGFDVNAAQRAKIEEGRQAEMSKQLTDEARAAEAAQIAAQNIGGQVTNLLGYDVAEQAKQLKPLELKGTMLSDLIAQQLTGYRADKKNELDLLINKVNNDQEMSMAEFKRLADLAYLEKNYELKKKEAAGNTGAGLGGLFGDNTDLENMANSYNYGVGETAGTTGTNSSYAGSQSTPYNYSDAQSYPTPSFMWKPFGVK